MVLYQNQNNSLTHCKLIVKSKILFQLRTHLCYTWTLAINSRSREAAYNFLNKSIWCPSTVQSRNVNTIPAQRLENTWTRQGIFPRSTSVDLCHAHQYRFVPTLSNGDTLWTPGLPVTSHLQGCLSGCNMFNKEIWWIWLSVCIPSLFATPQGSSSPVPQKLSFYQMLLLGFHLNQDVVFLTYFPKSASNVGRALHSLDTNTVWTELTLSKNTWASSCAIQAWRKDETSLYSHSVTGSQLLLNSIISSP